MWVDNIIKVKIQKVKYVSLLLQVTQLLKNGSMHRIRILTKLLFLEITDGIFFVYQTMLNF